MNPVRHLIGEQILLKGGFSPAHLEIADGRIESIHPLAAGSANDRAQQVRQQHPGASGQVLHAEPRVMVLPGVVDTHVHINEPGRTNWEGFATATAAAAAGGVTTLVDMPLNSIPPTVDLYALMLKRQAARGQIAVDTGFWGGIVPGNTGQLRPLWEAGVFGFKCFLLPSGVEEFPPVDSLQLRVAMREVARFDGLVIVHAEDAATVAAGTAGPVSSYAQWSETRPHESELRAIHGLIAAVRETGCRTHILHLASARALELIQSARAEGLPLTVETCPHYLCFEAELIPDGAAEFKCCPPIRDAGNREALWQGLQDGVIDAVVSDHSPATVEEKYRGAPDLQAAWGGISGLQVGFTAVADRARLRGIGVEQVSQWMAAHTAALVGMDTKGVIAPGSDADFALYDPDAVQQISADTLRHRNPITAYDGMEFTGQVVATVLRGEQLPVPPAGEEALRGAEPHHRRPRGQLLLRGHGAAGRLTSE